MTNPSPLVAGAILIGGQSRRMGGGDKCLQLLGGASLLSRIIGIFEPQVQSLLLNANGDPARFEAFELPVRPDCFGESEGPLAGILTAMRWAADEEAQWLFTVAGDAPFIPEDLVQRCLTSAIANEARMVCASSNGRPHPVCALWDITLAHDLERALVERGVRKIDVWTSTINAVVEDFSTDLVDPFFNVNAPQDLEAAERLLDGEPTSS